MRFTKMQGAGNDYIYVDCFEHPVPDNPAAVARDICDRHFGVGADGLILIRPSDVADARMQMFNADGSQAEMCGNGIRCVAKYVFDRGIVRQPSLQVETGNGNLAIDLQTENGRAISARVDMGAPGLAAAEIPTLLEGDPIVDHRLQVDGVTLSVTLVSMGNPHCVAFVEDASDELVLGLGPKIEYHPHFPERINVEFVEVVSPGEVRQRTWERGSGETWACGTGASAVCVAGVLSGRTERKIFNHLRGGDLTLEWDENSNHVFMTGPAVEVFSGDWPAPRP